MAKWRDWKILPKSTISLGKNQWRQLFQCSNNWSDVKCSELHACLKIVELQVRAREAFGVLTCCRSCPLISVNTEGHWRRQGGGAVSLPPSKGVPLMWAGGELWECPCSAMAEVKRTHSMLVECTEEGKTFTSLKFWSWTWQRSCIYSQWGWDKGHVKHSFQATAMASSMGRRHGVLSSLRAECSHFLHTVGLMLLESCWLKVFKIVSGLVFIDH